MQFLMTAVSFPGEKVPYLISVALLVLFFWFRGKHKLAIVFLTAGYAVAAVVQTLKRIFQIPRPSGALEDGFGFPSQHAASYVVVWGILMITTTSKILKLLGLLMILMVGVSRVYLGEHTVIDIIGGYTVGFMVLGLSWWWISRYGRQKS